MRYAGLLSGVGTCLADSDLISPMSGVDESDLGASEEALEQLGAVGSSEVAFDELDIVQGGELLGDEALVVADLGAHMPADGGGGANEGSSLSSGRVDGGNDFRCHHKSRIGAGQQREPGRTGSRRRWEVGG